MSLEYLLYIVLHVGVRCFFLPDLAVVTKHGITCNDISKNGLAEIRRLASMSEPSKFSNYQLEGEKENYKEVLVTIPSKSKFYIDKEKGLVEVDFEDTNDFYIFSIKDNGVGIAKEYHEKIFKIFNTLGDFEKSTGIGLSIVKKVVELYKGEIWLESEVGVGTTFFFSIKK